MPDEPNPADTPTEAPAPTQPDEPSPPAPAEPTMSTDLKTKAADLLGKVKADALAGDALAKLDVAHQHIVEGACGSLANPEINADGIAAVKRSICGGPHVQTVVRTAKRQVYQTGPNGETLKDKNGTALLKIDPATGAVVEEEYQESTEETVTAPALAGGEAIWKALSAAAGI